MGILRVMNVCILCDNTVINCALCSLIVIQMEEGEYNRSASREVGNLTSGSANDDCALNTEKLPCTYVALDANIYFKNTLLPLLSKVF